MKWKPNWPETQARFREWWVGKGFLFAVSAQAAKPLAKVRPPPTPKDLTTAWLDPVYRRQRCEYGLANAWYGGDAYPSFDTMIGPGSLGSFLGAEPVLEPTTVWYRPCITDPEHYPPIRFDPANNVWLDRHVAIIAEAAAHAKGRYAVGLPDLIENVDTLAAMRGNEETLYDLLERPAWVKEKLWEINQAFFDVFDYLTPRLGGAPGGNHFCAFSIWGPGKTAKVQCDFSCMVSVAMFREFVVPPLAAQCDWLDYSLYHLDGTNAMQHVDALLEIPGLNAIEWTPQAGRPNGGDPCWFDFYRRIKAGGKGVQVIGVTLDQLRPLLDAVGPAGTYVITWAKDQAEGEKMLAIAEQYR